MCAVCTRKAVAEGTALEIYHRGVDINGDVTLNLEYAIPRTTRPAQPVHRVERPVTAPAPRQHIAEKPCASCGVTLRFRDYLRGGGDAEFSAAERRFKWATHCGRCMTVWVEAGSKALGVASIDEMTAEHVKAWEMK